MMEHRYDDVICRALHRSEQRLPVQDGSTPLVIEPLKSANVEFLMEFLAERSSDLIEDLARHGALLLRGFDVTSPASFERSIHSIEGVRGMKDILFIHDGRAAPVGGTQFVLHTSLTKRLEKTGGTRQFGYFHTENYGIPDVPSYVALLCEIPSMLGGETGLLDMAKVYAEIPDSLKQKFAAKSCLVKLHRVAELSATYSASMETIEAFCESVSLPVVIVDGVKYVAIYKPSLVQHPLTREVALSVNFAYAQGLQAHVIDEFRNDYSGVPWLFHRRAWEATHGGRKNPPKPRRASSQSNSRGNMSIARADSPIPDARTLTGVIDENDRKTLAAAMRRHYVSFLWKRRDILIVDNLRMAHTGMPGFGKRMLKTMMCNPLHFYSSKDSPGLHSFSRANASRECLGAKLVQFLSARHYGTGVAISSSC